MRVLKVIRAIGMIRVVRVTRVIRVIRVITVVKVIWAKNPIVKQPQTCDRWIGKFTRAIYRLISVSFDVLFYLQRINNVLFYLQRINNTLDV